MGRKAIKFQEGYLYEVTFKDHATNLDGYFVCTAYGVCLGDFRDYVKFSSWIVRTDDVELFNSNLEKFVVVKSCIESARKLCQKKKF